MTRTDKAAILGIVCVGIGFLALCIYPFIIGPNLMSLAGHASGREKSLPLILWKSFLIGSLAYPVIFFPSVLAMILFAALRKERTAVAMSMIPVMFLILLAVTFSLSVHYG